MLRMWHGRWHLPQAMIAPPGKLITLLRSEMSRNWIGQKKLPLIPDGADGLCCYPEIGHRDTYYYPGTWPNTGWLVQRGFATNWVSTRWCRSTKPSVELLLGSALIRQQVSACISLTTPLRMLHQLRKGTFNSPLRCIVSRYHSTVRRNPSSKPTSTR